MEDVHQLRQAGMERAAVVWENLETLPKPIAPVNIFKAVSSVKCAEFANRVSAHKHARPLTRIAVKFLNDTLDIIGTDNGEIFEGARALDILAENMPMTDEIFNDPEAYATRQHVYDGLLLLAAAKLGKETETKRCLDAMQEGITMLFVMDYYEERGLNFDPDKSQA